MLTSAVTTLWDNMFERFGCSKRFENRKFYTAIQMIYSKIVKPILFRKDAEKAHEVAISAVANLSRASSSIGKHALTHAILKSCVAGLDFPNPVGLAAGCDKNARAVSIWPHCGFGFVEVGTITAQPQSGNPRPRVFRYPEESAVINRLGFNSEGSEAVARTLKHLRERGRSLPVPLAINIGKTKVVSDEELVLEDYRTSFRRLAPYADMIVINISSPNTPGLRQLQEKKPLTSLLRAIMEESANLSAGKSEPHLKLLPVFVKISPDMPDADMIDLVGVAIEQGISGIIATNTTIARAGAFSSVDNVGGLSGKPLKERANEVMQFLYRECAGRLSLIGVGGISSAEDAYQRIRSGASLVQFYTGMIYEGPYLAREINAGLIKLLQKDGFKSVTEAVGVDIKAIHI